MLGAYIESLENQPTYIISFDDDYNALSSIENMCNKRGIAFQGYHYLYAKEQKKILTFNKALEELHAFMQNRPVRFDMSTKY